MTEVEIKDTTWAVRDTTVSRLAFRRIPVWGPRVDTRVPPIGFFLSPCITSFSGSGWKLSFSRFLPF